MDLFIGLISIFFLLLLSAYKGIYLAYPLTIGLFILVYIGLRRKLKIKDLIKFSINGSKKAFLIVRIFMLIGAIIPVWMASGTIPFIIYYGLELINPKYFILSSFILSALVSLILGTSFGVVGTIGVVLMIIARSGNINLNVVGGAIIAGAYFGDRCSPMSSSAILVATITETDLYKNIKLMFKTSIIPLIASLIVFTILSLRNLLIIKEHIIGLEILDAFNINVFTVIPIIVILLLIIFKVDIKNSMLMSIIAGIFIAVFVQHKTVVEMLRYIFFGFGIENGGQLQEILKGGGIISMLKTSVIVLISAAYAGIFEGADLLKEIERFIQSISKRYGVFAATIFTSIATSSFGCTQTLAIILTYHLLQKVYNENNLDKYNLAIDIENSVVVIAALIPWNVAGVIPSSTLSIDSGFITYACYLYLLPILTLIIKMISLRYKRECSLLQ